MAEYIDRKEALDALLDGMVMTGYQSRAMDCVLFIPAADVAEVRHGRWIWHDDDYEYECSVCHIRFDYDKTYALFDNGYQLATYCPNCGAKMDERSEDNGTT